MSFVSEEYSGEGEFLGEKVKDRMAQLGLESLHNLSVQG